jgi:hypothetical protein
LIFDFLNCSNSVVFVLFVILLILSIINITNSSIFLYRRFRIVKLFCDNFSICNDKSDRRIQMTDFKSETSTMMTENSWLQQNRYPWYKCIAVHSPGWVQAISMHEHSIYKGTTGKCVLFRNLS